MIERSEMRMAVMLLPLALLLVPTAATAQEPGQSRPLRPLLDCRTIGEPTARLACFDRESAALDQADKKNELTVMDKEDVRKARRSLFGLNLSGLPLIGGGKDGEKDGGDAKDSADDGQSSITATIASSRAIGHGKWAFTLDDGAQWVTNEDATYREPDPGKGVVIKKGALGSYIASFGGKRAVKVRRTN